MLLTVCYFFRAHDDESWLEVPNIVSSDWSLVCATEQEWNEFVKKLKKSHQKQDKRLRKVIVNDFLPLIPEIIAEKVKLNTVDNSCLG